jgi:hypothetical protein
MKLTSFYVDLQSGLVTCQCELVVQDNKVKIPFTIPEALLYNEALNRGQDTWENIDVCTVGSGILGQTLTV